MNRFPEFPAKSPFTILTVAFAAASAITAARADVTMPAIFSSHMVLQEGIRAPVWGWADPGEPVTVTFGSQTARAVADSAGKWRVDLDKLAESATPQMLSVAGKTSALKFEDVLVGDVWFCSGQSNMGFWLEGDDSAKVEVPKASDPQLRLFSISEQMAIEPARDIVPWNRTKWRLSSPESAAKFTAAGYFFGKELRRKLNRPIGLVACSYGGTMAQGWISVPAIESHIGAEPDFRGWIEKRNQRVREYPERAAAYTPLKQKYDSDLKHWYDVTYGSPEYTAQLAAYDAANRQALLEGKRPLPMPKPTEPRPTAPEAPEGTRSMPYMVGNYYNAMVAPLIPYAIKGAIWYQGEANEGNAKQYSVLFPLLIADWREKWGEGNFPFLFVQLPNINKPAVEPVQDKDHWAWLRDAQAKTLAVPNTGMATIIDVGDPYNVHGKDKVDVGLRLSLVARHLVYGEDIVSIGPTYDSMKVEGGNVRVQFKNAGGGLEIGVPPWTPSGRIPPMADAVKGFAIAGVDRKWYRADAKIDGNSVVLSSDHVAAPVAVRYGWADNPPCNLYNHEKLPATPFRTDDWDMNQATKEP